MHLINKETDEIPPFMDHFDFNALVKFEMPNLELPPYRMPERKEKYEFTCYHPDAIEKQDLDLPDFMNQYEAETEHLQEWSRLIFSCNQEKKSQTNTAIFSSAYDEVIDSELDDSDDDDDQNNPTPQEDPNYIKDLQVITEFQPSGLDKLRTEELNALRRQDESIFSSEISYTEQIVIALEVLKNVNSRNNQYPTVGEFLL